MVLSKTLFQAPTDFLSLFSRYEFPETFEAEVERLRDVESGQKSFRTCKYFTVKGFSPISCRCKWLQFYPTIVSVGGGPPWSSQLCCWWMVFREVCRHVPEESDRSGRVFCVASQDFSVCSSTSRPQCNFNPILSWTDIFTFLNVSQWCCLKKVRILFLLKTWNVETALSVPKIAYFQFP